jgi:hypothetical protein
MTFGINLLLSFLMGASIAASNVSIGAQVSTSDALVAVATSSYIRAGALSTSSLFARSLVDNNTSLPIDASITTIPDVPFYSQFRDIHATEWKKLGCGVASLAMVIEFYHPGTVSVDILLKEGIAAGAYVKNAGWSHGGLALLASQYNLKGRGYDLSHLGMADAFAQFEKFLKEGPIIASVYYKFDPKSLIPHLVVINGIEGDRIYYNDPAGFTAGEEISVADFMRGWKKRFIVIKS